jgi:excisionase family DNA binding protein
MRLLRIQEAAEILRVTPQWVYVMARSGELPIVRIGRRVFIDPRRLEDWIAAGGQERHREPDGEGDLPGSSNDHCAVLGRRGS